MKRLWPALHTMSFQILQKSFNKYFSDALFLVQLSALANAKTCGLDSGMMPFKQILAGTLLALRLEQNLSLVSPASQMIVFFNVLTWFAWLSTMINTSWKIWASGREIIPSHWYWLYSPTWVDGTNSWDWRLIWQPSYSYTTWKIAAFNSKRLPVLLVSFDRSTDRYENYSSSVGSQSSVLNLFQ